MKFNCNIRKLKGAMSMAKRAMHNRPTLAELTAIKIVADKDSNTVALVCTDLEVMIGAEFEADVEIPGECGVQWKDLNNILPQSCDYEAEAMVWWEDGYVFTQEQDLRQRVRAQDMTDFPIIPQIELKAPKLSIGDDIGVCFPFMSTESDRMSINGVYVDADGKTLNFTATDGRICKCIKRPFKAKKAEQFNVTFNRRACAALKVKFRGEVQVGTDAEVIRVHGEKGELIYRDNLSPFPDYNAILEPSLRYMQRSDVIEMEFDRLELIGKLERMCEKAVQKEAFASKWIYVLLEDGMAKLKYRDTKTKVMADDTIQPRMTTGNVVFAIHPHYLQIALKAIKHQSVTLYVKPENGKRDPGLKGKATLSPMLMVPREFEDGVQDYTLLMPMKVDVEKEEELDFKEEKDDGNTDSDND